MIHLLGSGLFSIADSGCLFGGATSSSDSSVSDSSDSDSDSDSDSVSLHKKNKKYMKGKEIAFLFT